MKGLQIREIGNMANATAHAKGWYDKGQPNIAERLALVHSEISEALEEWRHGHPLDTMRLEGPDCKPEGFGVELADAVIRICDLAKEHGIDLEECILAKMTYNERRPYRHGGKVA